jgi:hypothetical protein
MGSQKIMGSDYGSNISVVKLLELFGKVLEVLDKFWPTVTEIILLVS